MRLQHAAAAEALRCLRGSLDRSVVGHADAKTAVALALACREHVFIEGPTGTAKTALAEAAAAAVPLPRFAHHFHRDTRASDLLGDVVLRREVVGDGEVLASGARPGGLLTCGVAVLDDLPRAPGEALSVLLRVLAERRHGGQPIPLCTAVATAAPNAGLDSAVLDRFALQVRVAALAGPSRAALLDGGLPHDGAVCDISAVHRAVAETEFSGSARRGLLRLLRDLRERVLRRCPEFAAAMTDRTFLVKAPAVMRAHAVLHGRDVCTAEDLRVVPLLTAMRLPASVVEEEVRESVERAVASEEQRAGGDEKQKQQQQQSPAGASSGAQGGGGGGGQGAEGGSVRDDFLNALMDEHRDALPESAARDTVDVTGPGGGAYEMRESIHYQPPTPNHAEGLPRLPPQRLHGVAALMRALRGELQRGLSDPHGQVGAPPRALRTIRSFSDIADCDAIDLTEWVRSGGAGPTPRGWWRARKAGGGIVIVRDCSGSMHGTRAAWAGTVCLGAIRQAAQLRMRVGYCEFSSGAWTRGPTGLAPAAAAHRAVQHTATDGSTNYRAALTVALRMLEGQRDAHMLFVTDGKPTMGCRELPAEIAKARSSRVRVHTIFIARQGQEYPAVLERLSRETGGRRWTATEADGGVRVAPALA
eukprot:TRINITY_DN6207_c1_g1_i1.p2 TRINITY_DN6207_c1_g1~~TRINITY_DN6207_c1_g1_i1.p2  ORF type:complete len:646 (+),score=263.14 TRINITY_DN6207_c1_g1_i1:58-1995(+)